MFYFTADFEWRYKLLIYDSCCRNPTPIGEDNFDALGLPQWPELEPREPKYLLIQDDFTVAVNYTDRSVQTPVRELFRKYKACKSLQIVCNLFTKQNLLTKFVSCSNLYPVNLRFLIHCSSHLAVELVSSSKISDKSCAMSKCYEESWTYFQDWLTFMYTPRNMINLGLPGVKDWIKVLSNLLFGNLCAATLPFRKWTSYNLIPSGMVDYVEVCAFPPVDDYFQFVGPVV